MSDKHTHATPWGLVLLLVGAGVAASFQIGKVPPVLPVIRAEFGMSLFLAGWLLSVFTIIGLVVGSTAGLVADTFGHRRLMILGLLFLAAGSLFGSFAPGAALLLVSRIIEGAGFLILAVSASTLISSVTRPEDLRLALAAWSACLPTGTALVMMAFPILKGWLGWRGFWQLNAVILIAYAVWSAKSTRHLSPPKAVKTMAFRPLLKDLFLTTTSTGPLVLAFIFSTYTSQWFAVSGFLPTLFTEVHGLGLGAAAMLTALVVTINIPGNLMGGWLLQRGFRRWRLIAFASLTMGSSSLVIYSGGLPFSIQYTACLVFSGIGGIIPASLFSGVPLFAPRPDLVATTNGVLIQGSHLGNTLGPPALAMVVSISGGWHAAPWLLGAVAMTGLGLSLVLGRLERQKENLPDR